ncbi:MAG: OmpA family protein [Acidobacteriia bacterium]|nr:OmpA family protein [Terriglobia bacterium]
MFKSRQAILLSVLGMLLLLVGVVPASAQEGKLKVRANPREAYLFVDGQAMRDARSAVRLSAGQHKIMLYNYGYKPAARDVSITAGKTTTIDVALESIPGTVNGPWGAVTIEGVNRNAVLLNGKTPEYFVGHGDEFNHAWLWKQELIVPAGTHQLTVLDGNKEVWSGSVNVPANQRVVIDAHKGGVRKTIPWQRGEQLKSLPPFKAGQASATVAVMPVSAQFSAAPAQINCGESAKLSWSSSGAVENEISGIGKVAASGDQAVQPKQTTAYTLTAAGPGGKATPSATVDVNSGIQASLGVSPTEIRYHRKGDKVLEQGSATVTWSASGADTASLDPFGAVSSSGTQTVQATPKKSDLGPVDETVTYTLKAANACGGSETRTAALHITGTIEPIISVEETTLLETRLAMNSVYFPTALPNIKEPDGGLVASQQSALTDLATGFKRYLEARPEAHLIIQAHADRRGSKASNQALSERRSARVKQALIDGGIPAGALETVAYGSEQNLSEEEVKQLVENNPNLDAAGRKKLMKNWQAIVLANNRRVDVMLSTTKQQSTRYFPFNAEDFKELMREHAAAAKKK